MHQPQQETIAQRLLRMELDLARMKRALIECNDPDDMPRLRRAIATRTEGLDFMREVARRHNLT